MSIIERTVWVSLGEGIDCDTCGGSYDELEASTRDGKWEWSFRVGCYGGDAGEGTDAEFAAVVRAWAESWTRGGEKVTAELSALASELEAAGELEAEK